MCHQVNKHEQLDHNNSKQQQQANSSNHDDMMMHARTEAHPQTRGPCWSGEHAHCCTGESKKGCYPVVKSSPTQYALLTTMIPTQNQHIGCHTCEMLWWQPRIVPTPVCLMPGIEAFTIGFPVDSCCRHLVLFTFWRLWLKWQPEWMWRRQISSVFMVSVNTP